MTGRSGRRRSRSRSRPCRGGRRNRSAPPRRRARSPGRPARASVEIEAVLEAGAAAARHADAQRGAAGSRTEARAIRRAARSERVTEPAVVNTSDNPKIPIFLALSRIVMSTTADVNAPKLFAAQQGKSLGFPGIAVTPRLASASPRRSAQRQRMRYRWYAATRSGRRLSRARALCLDPAKSRGGSIPSPQPHPHRIPARPRPHHPLHRLPPAQGQDPGLPLRRGRPLPHAADPHARGGADRPRDRPRAAASTRTSPRRWRSPTTSAIRPSATPASARSTAAMAGLRRLRPQRPEPARRDAARAALSALRRAEPDLGDAGGAGQAQRPADRCRRSADRPLCANGLPFRDRRIRRRGTTCGSRPTPGRRRRRRRSPTTSPTTPTTSTTGCAPGCSTLDASPSRAYRRDPRRDRARVSRPRRPSACAHELVRRLITAMIEDVIAREPRAARRARAGIRRRRARGRAAGGRLLAGDGGGRACDQGDARHARLPPPAGRST